MSFCKLQTGVGVSFYCLATTCHRHKSCILQWLENAECLVCVQPYGARQTRQNKAQHDRVANQAAESNGTH